LGGVAQQARGTERYGFLQGAFRSSARGMKYGNKDWNTAKHDFLEEFRVVSAVPVAFALSRVTGEGTDPFCPGMTWGNGRWPSLEFARHMATTLSLYGAGFPARVDLLSLYGFAFQYADKTLNGATFTGSRGPASELEAANHYIKAVLQGIRPLDFVLYVPPGLGTMAGHKIPNVEETEDPATILTARFGGGREVW
jgi:hypothetical protein